jgi:GntR family transcriptional regulator
MKYQRIREQLLSEIATGAFSEGKSFPSENALAERFSVSRMTARRALGELERSGYLTRIPGRGNTLKKPSFNQGFFTVKPFRDYAKHVGAVPKTQLITATLKTLPELGKAKLKVEQAFFVHRLRSLDGENILEEQRYLRKDLCAGILKEDLENESIHDLLIHKFKLPLTKVWQQLTVVNLDEKKAALFGCPNNTAAFLLERVTYTFDEPVTWVTYLMRGDKYSFENEFIPQEETR